MPNYIVYSETYMTGGYDMEPPEPGADVWEGEAKNKAEAKRLAWAHWRKVGARCLDENIGDRRHPMAGVKVERSDQCAHGYPLGAFDCDGPDDHPPTTSNQIKDDK